MGVDRLREDTLHSISEGRAYPRPRSLTHEKVHLWEVVLKQHVRVHPGRVGPHRDGLGVRLGLRRNPHAAAAYTLTPADRLDLYIHEEAER